VLARPQAGKLKELRPITLDGARQKFGHRISEEDLLLRLTMPGEQVDAMVAARDAADGRPHGPLPAGRPGRSPLVTLLKELERRPSLTRVEIRTEDERVVWRRG
jgi:oxaloacetate decarboxylase (Na+ extruding) subunit alpha